MVDYEFVKDQRQTIQSPFGTNIRCYLCSLSFAVGHAEGEIVLCVSFSSMIPFSFFYNALRLEYTEPYR